MERAGGASVCGSDAGGSEEQEDSRVLELLDHSWAKGLKLECVSRLKKALRALWAYDQIHVFGVR